MPMEAGTPNETVDDNRAEAIHHGDTPVILGQEFVEHIPSASSSVERGLMRMLDSAGTKGNNIYMKGKGHE